jgi:hypothetical protein
MMAVYLLVIRGVSNMEALELGEVLFGSAM